MYRQPVYTMYIQLYAGWTWSKKNHVILVFLSHTFPPLASGWFCNWCLGCLSRCLLIAWQYACDWLLVLMTRFRLFNPCCIAKLWRFVPLLLGSMCLGPPLTVPDSALRDGRAPAHRQTDTSRIQFQHLAALFVKGLWRCQHWIFCAAALSRLLRCPNTSAGPWALGTGQERLSKDDSWNLSLGTPYFKKSRRWDCLDCLCNQRLADPWDSVEYCFVASAFQAV